MRNGCKLRGTAAAAILLVGIAASPCNAELPGALGELVQEAREATPPVVTDEALAYLEGLPDQALGLLDEAIAEETIVSAEHLAVLLTPGLPADRLELLARNNCLLCHTDSDFHGGETLISADPGATDSPSHMVLNEVLDDVHMRHGLECAGCHGGDPTAFMEHDHPEEWPEDPEERRKDRSWIPGFCGRCHADSTYMRRFNPSLPTDQVAKYAESHHGRLLLDEGDSKAAQCVSCHGKHGIRPADSPRSHVHAKNIPATCGSCHSDAGYMAGYLAADGKQIPTDQVEQYSKSVHGIALLERGDTGAAVCNDCHGNHAAMPPQVASVSQICRTCHAGNGTLFDGSRHKEVFEANGWPECGACHGNHAITVTHDGMLGTGPESVCTGCHAEHAKDNPKCNETADYFHLTITEMDHLLEEREGIIEGLAERGLDVEPIEEKLAAAQDALKTSRSYIHAFNRSEFDQAATPGLAALDDTDRLVAEAEDELWTRMAGLSVTVMFTGLLCLAIYLKLREHERLRDREDSPQ